MQCNKATQLRRVAYIRWVGYKKEPREITDLRDPENCLLQGIIGHSCRIPVHFH